MKRIGYILISLLLLVGCFDDDSNMDIQELNPIVITTDGETMFTVTQLDTLKIEPLIFCNGVSDTQLSFEWMLMNYGEIVPRLLDTTMYLCAQIVEAPGIYTLRLTVTDKTTGIFRIETYSVTVVSKFSNGLLIADTKDGGQTSDLTLIRSREFSTGINIYEDEPEVYRDIWKSVNGAPFDGKILDVSAPKDMIGGAVSAAIVTTKNIYWASYKDYVQRNTGDDCFYVKPPFSGQEIYSARLGFRTNGSWEPLMVNGLFYERSLSAKYGAPVYPNEVDDYNISMMVMSMTDFNLYPVYAYDALGKRMLFFNGTVGYKPVNQMSGPFDVNDLSQYNVLYMGEKQGGIYLLAEDIETGAKQALEMKGVIYPLVSNESGFAQTIYDLSEAPQIDNARYYTSSYQGTALYYATETELYAGPFGNMGTASLQWQVEPGETITGLYFYDWKEGNHWYGGITGDEETTQSSNGRLVMVVTQNANGEGKLTAIPVINKLTGQLEQNKKYNVILEGFGEILGVYQQTY